MKVLVPLADGFEEMEGIIIIDVLRRAGLEVRTASLKPGEVLASRKTRHIADTTIDTVRKETFDAVVLPGGAEGARNLATNGDLADILKDLKNRNKLIGAICAAPNVLLQQGILGEQDSFTLHPGTKPDSYVGKYEPESRVVRSGNVFTSKGPGTAFEFALNIVEELCGKEVRDKVAAPMFVLESD
ncbi:MAG: DJ-1/PfpI family protein [Leptospiraceae bacterium]